MSVEISSTWLEVDLGAIQNNIRQIQSITKRPVMAVVKANGYGHGILAAAQAAEQAGARWLAVARIDEALQLRRAGVVLPLLVMGYCPPERVPEAAAGQVHLTVYDPDLSKAYAESARASGGRLRVHLKVDTGMGRLGVFPGDAVAMARLLAGLDSLQVDGIFTHFARADEPTRPETDQQIDRFLSVLDALEAVGLRPPLVHAANSAASLYFPRAYFDMVRPGISIYGLQPSPEAPLPEGFRAALSWKARLASVKELPPGSGVGYNYRYYTRGTETIGVVPVGYADGLRRKVGVNFALVGGSRVSVVGGVCMDQCMVRLDEAAPGAYPGDEVVLIGRQGDAAITAEEIGEAWGTINYEVVCGLSARVPRIYR